MTIRCRDLYTVIIMSGTSFGLDIGSHSIKAVELEKQGDAFKLLAFGSIESPPSAIFSESELDQKELAQKIKTLIKEAHLRSRDVVTAFPESLIFTRVIEMPSMNEAELKNAIKWQAEQYVPVPLSDIRLSWQVLEGGLNRLVGLAKHEEPAKKMKVLLVAAPITLIDRYLKILMQAGLNPAIFETEILAIVRALTSNGENQPTTAFVSIGASTTDICITDHGVIQFTRSIGTGGIALARAVAQSLGFDSTQAEEYKKSYGMLEDQLGGKIMQIIKPVLDVIASEIDRAIISYQTRNPSQPVRRVVLTGGTAQLPGLIVYLAENLGIEVQMGEPWQGIGKNPQQEEALKSIENQANFAVAVGLAKRIV